MPKDSPINFERWTISILFFLLISILIPGTSAAQDNDMCLGCHSDNELTGFNANDEEISVFVDEEVYAQTVHADMACADCHTDLADAEDGHSDEVEKVDCSMCHDEVNEIYSASIHGQLHAIGDNAAPVCSSCHGKHNIFTAADDKSTVNKFNLMFTCAECHNNSDMLQKRGMENQNAMPQFYESVHARGLLADGLIVAPSCNDCHGTHNIQNSENPSSPLYKKNVYGTCGKCHTKVEEKYKTSVHGQLVESGDVTGPVCTDCHDSHNIIDPREVNFKQNSDQKCGKCHTDMLHLYEETFHGKAMALGSDNVAACYDCHGYHEIVPSDNPASKIHPDNKAATCAGCHEGAGENFASYITHGSHYDKENYPQLYYTYLAMTGLLIFVFIFFGLHTVLWVVRAGALFFRDSKAFKAAKIKVHKDDETFTRFKPIDRFLHMLMMTSFITLVCTGMPLKFYADPWAKLAMTILGGVENAGYIHRFAALLMVLVFVIHVYEVVKKMFGKDSVLRSKDKKRYGIKPMLKYLMGPDSIVPNPQDVRDFWAHQRWFFGKGPRPQFERWTYWEKFDYLAVFWGIFIIGFSGLIMWAPVFFSKIMPGWMINIALIIHSDEALLATGFIFTFHFFNVHFRIEKFPMDTVIFSGRISREELKQERGKWLERLEKTGELEKIKTEDDWEGWKPIFKSIGFAAFVTGLLLAAGIFTAMFMRMIT